MKYCVTPGEKEDTCYHEFYRGKWDRETFWKEDSLLVHDDVLFSMKGFICAIKEVIPEYDPYGVTEVSTEEWWRIVEVIPRDDQKSRELYNEINEWAKDVFRTSDCFTILGL